MAITNPEILRKLEKVKTCAQMDNLGFICLEQ
jgi:hypothetical protein